MIKLKWKDNGINSVLEVKDFYISFNGDTNSMLGMSMFDWDNNGSCETALCKGDSFLILNGDFRKEYEKVISKGYKACKEVFNKFKKKHKSSWSN